MKHLLQKGRRSWFCGLSLAMAALALDIAPAHGAGISEPETIFYGRIINRTSGREYLLTEGTLAWIIGTPDGRQVPLTATLEPLNGGMYSYRLLVPHEALNYGLDVSSNAVPLPAVPAVCAHLQVLVNGSPATLMAPGSSDFSVAQSLRAATYRLDLEVGNALASTSGDGIPDWWKDQFGVVDPNADPDGDGWNNFQEFLMGGNPGRDDRSPSLEENEVFVYAEGTTGIRLHTIDADSAPANLSFTLATPPSGGTLYLRNGSPGGDAALAAGAVFTQDDLNQGRVVFVQTDTNSSLLPASFAISLRDENTNHAATNVTVALNVYRPGFTPATLQQLESMATNPASYRLLPGLSSDEQQMALNYFLSRDQGYTIWDASRATEAREILVPSSGLSQTQYTQYVASFGHDHKYVLLGGAGNDHLVGGMENDILIGQRGSKTLRGNGGADLFVIAGGTNTIEDFNPAEHDAIDISRLLTGTSGLITNYVQITHSGTNSYLALNFSGAGSGFTNLVVTLLGTQLGQSDLRSLVDNGNLITGNRVFAPGVSIAASVPAASQNGPVPGQFTFTRTGGTESSLTVGLQITGSAVNGTDYQFIPSQVVFAAGQSTATLDINPYANSSTVTKVVQIALLAGTGYELGGTTTAQVTIEPLSPQISIEAIEPVAVQDDQSPGLFLVTRGGVLDRSVLVRLNITGTAPNGTHYTSVSQFLNLQPQQTTALITITPKTGVVISNGLEYVQISIKPDSAYKVMEPSFDRVLLISQWLTGAQWQQKYFAGSALDWTTFAQQDTGSTGIKNLFRYAFGLDPLNPAASQGLPAARIMDGSLAVSFRQPAAVTDLDYIVEVSTDLTHWRSGDADIEPFQPAAGGNDPQMVYYRSKSPVSAAPRQFLRVRVVPQ